MSNLDGDREPMKKKPNTYKTLEHMQKLSSFNRNFHFTEIE